VVRRDAFRSRLGNVTFADPMHLPDTIEERGLIEDLGLVHQGKGSEGEES
jgi:hypothetical protein